MLVRKSNFHLDFPCYFSEWTNTRFWCFIKEESEEENFEVFHVARMRFLNVYIFFYEAFTLTQISPNFEHFMLTKGCWKITLWAYKITRAHVSELQSRIGLYLGRFKKEKDLDVWLWTISYHIVNIKYHFNRAHY